MESICHVSFLLPKKYGRKSYRSGISTAVLNALIHQWQGGVLTQNYSAGIIMSTQSLVLQGIGRDNGGNYTCLASNDRGETTSPIVNLRVQCK